VIDPPNLRRLFDHITAIGGNKLRLRHASERSAGGKPNRASGQRRGESGAIGPLRCDGAGLEIEAQGAAIAFGSKASAPIYF
jgi:hypothetical protein